MSTPQVPSVGFVGLGLMGRPMARRLHAAGVRVSVHNRSPGPVQALCQEGLLAAGSVAATLAPGSITILMLTDTPAVDAVVHGEGGVLDGLRRIAPGAAPALIVDMGTTAVEATRSFAEEVAACGGRWLDAPVSGGVLGVRDGTLSIMVGGATEDLARARPLLAILGQTLTHVGEVGAGQVAKAANQVIVGLNIAAVAEALTLARAAGADPERVCAALAGGFAASRVLEVHGPRMSSGNFEPGARATTQLKDMRQALSLAASLGLELDSTRLNAALYERLVEQGDGDLDHSALVRLWRAVHEDGAG